MIAPSSALAGTLPDGGKGLTYTSRYAIVGANALGLPVLLDGINDQGLSVGLFYFPGYASIMRATRQSRQTMPLTRSRPTSSAYGRSPISRPWMRYGKR